jgi:hypothetical protein
VDVVPDVPAGPPRPLAVGGIGGSGTRVVAQLLIDLGMDLGTDLNDALDNLWFSMLFKRADIGSLPPAELSARQRMFLSRLAGTLEVTEEIRQHVAAAVADHPKYRPEWLAQRSASFLAGTDRPRPRPSAWGWKEPNTHLLIEEFLATEPDLRYLHLDRNGVEMAFSRNNQQARTWGPAVVGRPLRAEPRDKLAFWCAAHRRMAQIAARHPHRIRLIRFEDLLADPESVAADVADFAGLTADPAAVATFAAHLRRPLTRSTGVDLSTLDPADVSYVASVGYPVSAPAG